MSDTSRHDSSPPLSWRRPSLSSTSPGVVLVVDDKPENLSLLSSVLSAEGYEVRAAITGAMALVAAAADPPDIILLDVNMPEMDGYEVCRRLKADRRTADVPVIFISVLSELEDKVAAFDAGGVDYVTKPFHVQEVLARVGTQLLLHRQRRELARQQKELSERYLEIQQLHATLREYLSDRAWASIAAASASPEAPPVPTREVLTILITDVAGFVRISEQIEPGPLLADLSLYLATLTQAIHRRGGQVDKYLGDGVLSFFKDAGAAVLAAHDLQREIAAFNGRLRDAARPIFPTRLGIATGPVVLASIGSQGRREFTLIGDRVNVASRLQAEAIPGGILMDARTWQAAGRPAGAKAVTVLLKGKQEAEAAYAIVPDLAAALPSPS
ncbi:response regulator [Chondromyces crocatus]|uniref:Transcriptional regulator n=1 Tax=Chondromyces crocatus TaxID=52 RepID=A0A0K1E625_CHOCO|nr:response regulator [Chondromyces crocatus]AKT36127.1 transcriptional regulator [Chondromyces crocatus]